MRTVPSPASALLTSIIKKDFGPALVERGMVPMKGRSFRLSSDNYFALLGFQTDKWSRPDCSIFTVNLKVVSKNDWAAKRAEVPWLPDVPNANDVYVLAGEDFEWSERLGFLLPNGEDTWWEVRPNQDNSAVIAEVRDALIHVAVPELQRRTHE